MSKGSKQRKYTKKGDMTVRKQNGKAEGTLSPVPRRLDGGANRWRDLALKIP
jgi:hypothetical protein